MSIYNSATFKPLSDIIDERKRQDEKWGPQRDIRSISSVHNYAIHPAAYYQFVEQARVRNGASTWTDILLEEVAEAIEEAKVGNTDALRKELIQVAAVAVHWVENLDRS